jgi:hypothetical protein
MESSAVVIVVIGWSRKGRADCSVLEKNTFQDPITKELTNCTKDENARHGWKKEKGIKETKKLHTIELPFLIRPS